MSEKYTDNRYVGIDFSVKTATRKYSGLPNLRFVNGYALDLLELRQVVGDIVFASSTFVVFLPQELALCLRALRRAGFRQIVLNEPTWAGYVQSKDGPAYSRHMEGACWFHNYCGYLKDAGYDVHDFSFLPYKHPVSHRPDIFISLVRAVRA